MKKKNLTRIAQQEGRGADPQPIVKLEPEGAGADARPRKRHREGSIDVHLEENHEWGFMLPLYFSEPNYLGRFPLSVSLVETQAIELMSPSARARQLAENGASVIRMLEMARVLALRLEMLRSSPRRNSLGWISLCGILRTS